MRQTKCICCLLLTVIMLFSAIPINAAVIIGSVLTTDIKAYINGCEIPSYNIDGNIVVVGQDLRSYGFNVVYDNNTRTSYISYDGSGTWTPIAPSIKNSQSIGTKVMDVYQSDISVSVNGNKVACYNVGGKMAFRFAELKIFGNYSYNNETRSANLWVGETKSNEIDNVSAVSSSSVANDFDNIYIDESGNLIFELSNGSVINAGAVLNGKDGRDGQDGESGRNGLNGRDGLDGKDGVSIVNAYVDSEGDLIVELSNHKVINAGNVGSNYSADKLTFADYEVGTKFYLTQPTGEFEVNVDDDDVPYTVKFSEIYYELTAKNDFNDENSWIKSNRMTKFVPYEVTVHIDGVTDTNLAGRKVEITFADSSYGNWRYCIPIENDGSFSLSFIQGRDGTNYWGAPKILIFKQLIISIVNEPEKPSNPDDEKKELISYFAGTWTSPDEPDNVIVLKEDGTIIENDVEYTPSYSVMSADYLRLYAKYKDRYAVFCKSYNEGHGNLDHLKFDGCYYYRDGTWLAVSLNAENFYDYFEYHEKFSIKYNAFGEWKSAEISRYYDLKDEYQLLCEYDKDASKVAVKYNVDVYSADFIIDFENETYTVTPGKLEGTYADCVWESRYGGDTRWELWKDIFRSGRDLSGNYDVYDLIDATGTLYLSKNTDR